ncbi:FAD-binding domain-containing protein, partial [Hymenopellis radicata]
EQQLSYFSLHQTALKPACVVRPSTSIQIGQIFGLSDTCELTFAVRGGGHMAWGGASSVNAPGFTIDLGNFRDIEYDPETELVTFGAGLRWGDVYDYLSTYNRTTRGGRAMDVGVGGFLLGVHSYKIIVASGDALLVSENSYADLFWVLKMGGSNFGIVIEFTMTTRPNFDVWGGIQLYKIEALSAVTDAQVKLAVNLGKDVKDYIGMAFLGNMVWVHRIRIDNLPEEIASPEYLMSDSIRVRPIHDVYKEVTGDPLAQPAYHEWHTLSLTPDSTFAMQLFDKAKEMFGSKEGWSLGLQPLPGHLFKDNDDPVLSMLCIDPHLLLFMSSNPDVPLRKLVDWTEKQTPHVKPFIYLNYASGDQNVYRGTDLKRFWKVKHKYDSLNFFGQHWAGGFKLPSLLHRDESEL